MFREVDITNLEDYGLSVVILQMQDLAHLTIEGAWGFSQLRILSGGQYIDRFRAPRTLESQLRGLENNRHVG